VKQSQDELDAHYGPGGPVEAAKKWIWAVLHDGDLRMAWRLTDEVLRRALAEAWVMANGEHPAVREHDPGNLIEGLSRETSRHYLWNGFAETQIAQFRELWSDIDLEGWGWASKPRLISPGYERVLLVEAGGEPIVLKKEQAMEALAFVMHEDPDRGWLVAEVGGSERETSATARFGSFGGHKKRQA
jgi:hypothetical protein